MWVPEPIPLRRRVRGGFSPHFPWHRSHDHPSGSFASCDYLTTGILTLIGLSEALLGAILAGSVVHSSERSVMRGVD